MRGREKKERGRIEGKKGDEKGGRVKGERECRKRERGRIEGRYMQERRETAYF